MNEIWKDIKGYEGYYEISNIGRVRSVSRIINHPKLVKQNIFERLLNLDSQNGYKSVRLSKEHKSKKCFVHRLVAQAFIKNPDSKGQVNHKDGDKSNNKVDNLEWNTAKENIRHYYKYICYRKGVCNTKTRGVLQIDRGNIIAEFDSIAIASRMNNIHNKNIQMVCAGKRTSAGGFNWKYKE